MLEQLKEPRRHLSRFSIHIQKQDTLSSKSSTMRFEDRRRWNVHPDRPKPCVSTVCWEISNQGPPCHGVSPKLLAAVGPSQDLTAWTLKINVQYMSFPPMVMCLENLYLGLQDTKSAVPPESILPVFFENPSPNIYVYVCIIYIYYYVLSRICI